MEYQRFIPEGWSENIEPVTKDFLTNAIRNGSNFARYCK